MHSAHWGDIPTWVGAIATVLAAIGAFIAVGIAFNQLKDQRKELERQRDEQQRIVELQTEQLKQLRQQAREERRRQAAQITVTATYTTTMFRGIQEAAFAALVVENKSSRPIRNLTCRLIKDGTELTSKVTHVGRPPSDKFAEEQKESAYEPVRMLRPDIELWFLWPVPPDSGYLFKLRFTDDADNPWELDQDMQLTEPAGTGW